MDKVSLDDLRLMSLREVSQYMEDICHTTICKDKKYCDDVVKIFMSKPLTVEEGQLKLF